MACDRAIFLERFLPLPPVINLAQPRAAMGLPSSYRAGIFEQVVLPDAVMAVSVVQRHHLAQLVENAELSVRERLSAGALLALFGDPRIATLSPTMVDFAEQRLTLGTDVAEIPGLLKQYAHLSLKQEWLEKECPAFEVVIPAFRLGRYLVTHQEYRDFLVSSQAPYLPTSWHLGRYPLEQSNHPVWGIRREWAIAYCEWLSSHTGRRFHLPSECQWEAAAAGLERRAFPWGECFSPECANTLESEVFGTAPIGAFPAGRTPEGVFDMGGNVEEFVAGNYVPYAGAETVKDDLYAHNPSYPMTRGGGFSRFGDLTRSRRRHGFFDSPLYAYGFRLAEEVCVPAS